MLRRTLVRLVEVKTSSAGKAFIITVDLVLDQLVELYRTFMYCFS